MAELWFAIFWAMVAVYAILDGRNIGVGALHLIVARTLPERRQVVEALGPLWSWDEVWLISAGGVLLMAFPRVLAASFSGYYLALFLVLWLLILRGMSLEVGGHIDHPLWQTFWNFVFAVSSALLAILLGAALGNIVRGDPLDANGEFHLAFFTDFGVRGNVGLLDWFTISLGVFALVALAAHGATYLIPRTHGPVQARAKLAAKRLWLAAGVFGIIIVVETCIVRPDQVAVLAHRPLAWLFLALGIGGAAAIFNGLTTGRESRAYAGSCALIAGFLAVRTVLIFPVMLYSTLDAHNSLTIYGAAAGHESLIAGIYWWPVALIFTCGVFMLISKQYFAKPQPHR